jgi:poly(3-hydroxybutyrate) depolymerase
MIEGYHGNGTAGSAVLPVQSLVRQFFNPLFICFSSKRSIWGYLASRGPDNGKTRLYHSNQAFFSTYAIYTITPPGMTGKSSINREKCLYLVFDINPIPCFSIRNLMNVLAAVSIVSFAAAVFAQTTQTLNFQVAGKARNCVIHVPGGIDKPAIVFFLHGAGGSGAGFENDTKADIVADREKFIAAYPSGISGNWDYADGSNDFTFMMALIDTIDSRYRIDRNRVYVSGFSMGGGMTFALACGYADIFAAIAPVSAAGSACTPKRAIPVFLTFGTKDMSSASTYMASVNRWVTANGCPAAPRVTRPYPSSNPQSTVTRLTYGPGKDGVEVVADSIQGGGHGWPTDTRTSVNQADEVWAFFKKFSLNGGTAVHEQVSPAAYNGISASYISGIVRLRGVGEKSRVRVIDTRGRLVAAAIALQGQFTFTFKASGVYVVVAGENDKPVPLRMVIP